MNTIVLNTLTGAVSEYTHFGFQSVTPTHAGSATGLFTLGGDTDDGLPIVSAVTTPKTLLSVSLKKFVELIFLSVKGSGTSAMTVIGESASNTYPFPVRDTGESRCKPGRGIRENYLAFTYSNTDGADFQLDRIEVPLTQSTSRRT
jgi:hypothetical protein